MKILLDEKAFAAVVSFAYNEGWIDRDNMAKIEKASLADTPDLVDFSRPLAPPPDPVELAQRVHDIGVRIVKKLRANNAAAPPKPSSPIILPERLKC